MPRTGIPRRHFLRLGSVALTATVMYPWRHLGGLAHGAAAPASGPSMKLGAADLVVQPVLMHDKPQRVEGRSWRNWGGLQTPELVDQEAGRIEGELQRLSGSAEFGMRLLPLARVTSPAQAEPLKGTAADVLLIYAAGAGTDTLNALAGLGKQMVIFVRYKSGPYYLWHEIVDSRFLRSHTDTIQQKQAGIDDVVVDDMEEVRWRFQALYGLKNTIGRRIVCVGGPGGWSWPKAPELARARFQLDMIDLPIPELSALVEAGRKNEALMEKCQRAARTYIDAEGVKLVTTEKAVREAFLLQQLFYEQMAKSDAFAVTVRGCMNSYAGIMPCMTLTLINDEGYMAYCEGDFVTIPSGILLHFICGKPTYFCNPTWPHQGKMMFAHCTAPRRMDGKTLAPVELVTHYESDHGAATHVRFPQGQLLTILKPDFEAKNWLAMTGRILDNPYPDTCRAQVEVALHADTQEVIRNMRGFHCMLAYGDYTREVAYAASKVGIQVQVLKG